ncbi:hypothetical protein QP178_16810 [Sphingomonas aurantiaca]|uniref:hypothetical protein n=1 Tax=Sphingomonas aurantiaca TaxID=185949 RepID=UPI002FE3EC82
MAKVVVLHGDADELIGEFELDHLPRVEEYIYVPSVDDPSGLRIFKVLEVNHVAEGVPGQPPFGPGPRTFLRYCEEIT